MIKIGQKRLFLIFVVSIVLGFFVSLSLAKALAPARQATSLDNNAVLSETIQKCGENENCYNDEFRLIAREYDYDVAFAVLDKLVREKPRFSYCHFMAHSIGHGAYEKDPGNWNTTLNKISQNCSYGATHGLLEQYAATLREKNESLISKNIMRGICEGQRSSCGHILGHIVLVETEADVPKAIKACSGLDGDYYKWCIHGIFMEHVYPQTLVQHGLVESEKLTTSGRLSEFSSFCNSFTDPLITSTCWGEISRGAIAEFKDNWVSILGFCDTAPLPESQKTCKDRVVESLVVSRNFEIMPLKQLCVSSNSNQEFENNCYSRLIRGKMDNDLVIENDKAVEFCVSLKGQFQKSCFRQIGASFKDRKVNSKTVDIVCRSAPAEYHNTCRGI